ncbi:MAG TPA: methyltransferase regulatory domain-containing protein [Candidatus Megaira endosymbiont of Nemacystus decipiens]|nr:methyltransferase regulatory domain-containing protein [Candidatus Megaera endosymbiont of Nemacystus decipiens]
MSDDLTKIQQSYESEPYESYPYHYTSPEKLASLALLFGMNPPKISSAKVLELGCASGGNIIPHALNHPKGKYVGVDLSEKQISEGVEHIKKLGLKNIELKAMSISDIDGSFGKFDYIICHGVFSWVPESIQEKILEISNKNLSKNGVVYISYNTLPGWNMIRTIRDMMLYHSKGFATNQEKIKQSRALLSFVKDSLKGQDTPYANMLRRETETLSKQSDNYIFHEHLERNNKQFYFTDFITQASKYDLQYLSDVSLSSMYLGNMKPEIVEKLKNLKNILQTEQYLDFINNRRFRSSLLCHKGLKLNRKIENSMIKKFALSLNIIPEKPFTEEILKNKADKKVQFFIRGNKQNAISTKSPYLIAVLYVLSENRGFPMKFDTIVKKANKLFKENKKEEIEKAFIVSGINLIMKGVMGFTLSEIDKSKINLKKPKVNQMVQYQLKHSNKNWVTTGHHAAFRINIFDKVALSYMDGKNTIEKIQELLFKDVKKGVLSVSNKGKKVEEVDSIKRTLNLALQNAISRYSIDGIFI